MFGVADYQRIRTNEPPVLGLSTNMDLVAEFTKHYFVNDGRSEFQKLCSLDVLGLEDVMQPEEFNHQTFKDHIKYCEKGYYETALPWKPDHPPLPCHKLLTKARLLAITKGLE